MERFEKFVFEGIIEEIKEIKETSNEKIAKREAMDMLEDMTSMEIDTCNWLDELATSQFIELHNFLDETDIELARYLRHIYGIFSKATK